MCVADFYLNSHHDVALTSAFLQIAQPIQVIVLKQLWGTHYRLKAYPIEPNQQFQFIVDLTGRGIAVLNNLGVEYAAIPAFAEVRQVER